MASNAAKARYPVIVVGAGIGGLAVSILLAQQGHPVTVLERRRENYISDKANGISLWNNARRVVTGPLNLERELLTVADDTTNTFVKRYDTGETLRKTARRRLTSFVHRADLLKILYDRAVKLGVDVQMGKQITAVDDSSHHVTVTLHDSTRLETTLVIGADGIESQIRNIIFPNTPAVATGDCTFLVNVPEDVMRSHPETAQLWDDPPFHFFYGAGRSIVSWHIRCRGVYHLQMNDHLYEQGERYGYTAEEPDTDKWAEPFTNMAAFRHRWRDHAPGIRHILESADSCIKWRIAQVPPLDSWSSASGRVILLGDAAHGFPPYAGQGACTTLEDAAVLAKLVALAPESDALPKVAKAYYKTRMQRVGRMLEVIWDNTQGFVMMKDFKQQRKGTMFGGKDRRLDDGDEQGGYQSQKRTEWMEGYDAVTEAEDHWRRFYAGDSLRDAKI